MVSLRSVAVLITLSLSAAVVSAFAPGGNPGGMAKAAAVNLEGGGTKTPIRAITHPRTNVKEIASVSNTEEFESLLGLARPKQVRLKSKKGGRTFTRTNVPSGTRDAVYSSFGELILKKGLVFADETYCSRPWCSSFSPG